MASDTGHGNLAVTVALAEVEVERIVFDILAASVVLQNLLVNGWSSSSLAMRTVVYEPPARWPATALEIDGFSATQRTFIAPSQSSNDNVVLPSS